MIDIGKITQTYEFRDGRVVMPTLKEWADVICAELNKLPRSELQRIEAEGGVSFQEEWVVAK